MANRAGNGRPVFFLLVLAGLVAGVPRAVSGAERVEAQAEAKYPSHWWQPLPEGEVRWWEIPPQAAKPGEVILSKRHELGLFSNFSITPFYFHGWRYASVEGFWYMLAYPEGPEDARAKHPGIEWKHTREQVAKMVGFEAKDAGALAETNMAIMGINWVTFEGKRLKYWDTEEGEHYQLIKQVLWEKVRQNLKVRELLLSTGDLVLRPDNFDSLRGLPAWRYFEFHQEIRDTLRGGAPEPPSARYPAHWWTPIRESDRQWWEILPQAAGPGEVIVSKRHELGLLSNFAPTPFIYHGKRYASLEGFWQMMKYPDGPDDPRAKYPGLGWKHTCEEVAETTGWDAKNAGEAGEKNMEKMGIHWVTFEGRRIPYRVQERGEYYKLILEVEWEKLKQNPEVERVLLSTGDLILKPDHDQGPDPPPAWRYHEIWMMFRAKLQQEQQEELRVVPLA